MLIAGLGAIDTSWAASANLINSYRGGTCEDLSGAVWFADDFNCRVLRFRRIPKTTN